MDLNEDLHSKKLIEFNEQSNDWKWAYAKNEIYAGSSPKIIFAYNMFYYTTSLLTLFASLILIVNSGLSKVIAASLIILTAVAIIFGFFKINSYTVNRFKLDTKKTGTVNRVSEISLSNITQLLNLFKKYDKPVEYHNILTDLCYMRANDKQQLDNKYKDFNISSIITKLEQEKSYDALLGASNDINKINNITIDSQIVIQRNNGDVIKEMINKDSRLEIMLTLEKLTDHMSTQDYNDYTKCFDTLFKCNKIIDDTYDYLNTNDNDEDIVEFKEIVDTTMPVFDRIIANVRANRKAKLQAANIYLKDSLGVNGDLKEITGTMDYHSVDKFLKEKSTDKVYENHNK